MFQPPKEQFLFEYVNHAGRHASRKVDPIEITWCRTHHHQDYSWKLKAWCHSRKAYRHFELDGLITKAATDERSEILLALANAQSREAETRATLHRLMQMVETEESADRLVREVEKIRAREQQP